jgi:membrane protease YdiL (CAAX protease family)
MTYADAAAPRVPLKPQRPDFPYYRDQPAAISPGGWLLVLVGTVAGFAALVTPLPITDNTVTGWLRVAAFVGLPLLGLMQAAPKRWRDIFGRVGLREIKLMFVFALLNIAISMAIGVVIKTFGTATANGSIASAGTLGGPELLNFFAKVALQLLGEELITILPFLAILTFCHGLLHLERNASVIAAWLVSALAFGLAHLPTYDWNIVQCIVVIGSARLVLTWAYVWTKNIWVSTGAHIINDWTIMAATIFLPRLLAAS